mgnify:CR=1 FL=1
MKKILALVLVTLLLMFSLAGCTQADNLVHLETFYDKFKEDCFLTNKCSFNNPKYTPKLFKKTSVRYNTIIKIEKRLWNKKRFKRI